MRWVFVLALLTVGAIIALSLWVRLAPVDPARWHTRPPTLEPGDHPGQGRFTAVRELGEDAGDALAALDAEIRATPRTRVIAGSVEEGMITYETRSALWGFPDYTTVARDGGQITVHGRLRFGGDDLGVNRARIEAWLASVPGFTRP